LKIASFGFPEVRIFHAVQTGILICGNFAAIDAASHPDSMMQVKRSRGMQLAEKELQMVRMRT
jgi:hypothetical protein